MECSLLQANIVRTNRVKQKLEHLRPLVISIIICQKEQILVIVCHSCSITSSILMKNLKYQ